MKISRRISDYLIPDLVQLNEKGADNKFVYYTGDIIRYSDSLINNISKAENELFQDSRSKYVNSVAHVMDRLFRYCETLEQANSNGKDFLGVLRKELLKFQKIHSTWKLKY